MRRKEIDAYIKLAKVFKNKGFNLYLVGGTVRDFLLKLDLNDMDLVTDATPTQMLPFLKGADDTFKQYGSLKYNFEGVKFDITTLRVEGKYDDSRHPSKVKYVTDLKKDYVRRDFTINSMYLDSYFILYDYCHGQEDLKNKLIRFIGNPKKRIKEDPLRIIRAIRFALMYGFSFEEKTEKAMKDYSGLLAKINKDKIRQEVSKIKGVDKDFEEKLFKEFSIHQYIDVIE
ncbi:MAG: CCA tRNA nucleotidyltransferase [Erysipelotrichaceae bacterium]|nr:CCA tRNA nucleotidyltransferase [Erysipelotrichaceae bacterium]